MATMNISLPESMKEFLEEESAKNGFRTVSEYVRSIIREVQERQAEREKVDAQLLEALDSGAAAPSDQADWQNIRNEVHRRHADQRAVP
jgi:antitoxin ParD1/3/4